MEKILQTPTGTTVKPGTKTVMRVAPFGRATLPKKEKITQYEFTSIVPVKQGQVNALNGLLAEIGLRMNSDDYFPFSQLNRIHYCRWFVVDSATLPNGALVPPVLVFSGIFDGDINENLRLLVSLSEKTFDSIYSYTEGYPAQSGTDAKITFLVTNRHVEPLFWAAKKGGTVDTIRNEGELRDKIQDFLDAWRKQEDIRKYSKKEVYQKISTFVNSTPSLSWALVADKPKPTAFKNLLAKLLAKLSPFKKLIVIPLLPVIPFVLVWWCIGRYFEVKYNKNAKPIVLDPPPGMLDYEDRIFQNQLTIYGTLKKPYWFYRTTLKTFLTIANLKMKYTATKGNLSGIETIHFVSWVFFNDNRNVMFLSNYDGGWESYLNEFIDEAAPIMNLSFGSMIGYPPTKWIFKEGAHNEQAFKAVVRNHQYPCPVWYSAYPNLSIKNILNNSQIRNGLAWNLEKDEDISNWLLLLY